MSSRKKYVMVGIGGRSRMFYQALATTYKKDHQLAAFCDINQTRMDYANRLLKEEFKHKPVPAYPADRFGHMIKKEKPDVVIVTSIDRTHHKYIIRALELGCDVISEKPLTIDAEKCQAILDTIKKTKRKLRVTFNYRYAPHNTRIRELIMQGTIGNVISVHFEWLLDTYHGADYYRRWHRDKRNSGGLLVHKATHHFDLVNFWLGSRPQTVFCMGDLRFYGRANAEERGMTKFYQRATGNPLAQNDPFALHLDKNPGLKALYLDAEKEDGYQRDQSVFGDNISIEDSMAVMVKYRDKTLLSYSLNSFMPWEGYNVNFNGTKGRIEVFIAEGSYVNAGGDLAAEGAVDRRRIVVRPLFGKPYVAEIPEAQGGHGGGDAVLLEDLFGKPEKDEFNRAASHVDGALSLLTGIAANRSMNTGQPVRVDDLVSF